jgi:hypothetical protein
MLWRNISSDVAAQNQCFYAAKPDRDNLAARSIPTKLRCVVRRCDAKKPDHGNERKPRILVRHDSGQNPSPVPGDAVWVKIS